MTSSSELYKQAEALKEAGQLDQAVLKLGELLAQEETFALAHAALAVYLGRLGRHDEAVRHALRVCELEPRDPFSYTSLSVTCQRAGKIPEAEEALARGRMLQGGL